MTTELTTITPHTWGLVILIGVMVLTFVTQRLPVDVTAMGVLLVLILGGYINPHEAFQGFSSPVVVVMVATLFVVAGLRNTGVSDTMARLIQRCAGSSEPVVIVVVMIVSALLSSCMNNVSAAALLMPAVAVLAHETQMSPSRLFIPLAFAVTLGGTLTLIGTPPNIIAAEMMRQEHLADVHFFDFAPYGLCGLAAGIAFMALGGYRLLPLRKTERRRKRITDLRALYRLQDKLFSLRVPENSILSGKTLADLRFSSVVGGVVVTIIRGGRKLLSPRAHETLEERDVLLVRGDPERFSALSASQGLRVDPLSHDITAALIERTEIVRFTIKNVHTGSETLLLRDVLRSTGIIPLAIERVCQSGGWDSITPAWFLDSQVHEGDVVVGCISGRFTEDAPTLDLDLAVIHDPKLLLSTNLHLLSLDHGGWSGAPIQRIAREARLPILGRVREGGEIDWLEVPSILPGGERGPVRLTSDHIVREGEIYLVSGSIDEAIRRHSLGTLVLEAEAETDEIESSDVGIIEVVLTPRSELIGRNLADLHFREKYNSQVLALWRDGKPLMALSSQLPLRYGDALLIQGPRESFEILAKDPDFLLLSEHRHSPKLSAKSWFAVIALLLLMFAAPITGIPVHEVAFIAACLTVFSRAVTMEQAYREIDWRVVFLLALMIPLGTAVEHAGAAEVVAQLLNSFADPLPNVVVLAGFMILSSMISQLIDSSLAVIFLGPIAIAVAQRISESPVQHLMAVTFGASLAFMLPTSCRSNLLVTGAGGYRVGDYLRVGVPFTFVVGGTILVALLVLS